MPIAEPIAGDRIDWANLPAGVAPIGITPIGIARPGVTTGPHGDIDSREPLMPPPSQKSGPSLDCAAAGSAVATDDPASNSAATPATIALEILLPIFRDRKPGLGGSGPGKKEPSLDCAAGPSQRKAPRGTRGSRGRRSTIRHEDLERIDVALIGEAAKQIDMAADVLTDGAVIGALRPPSAALRRGISRKLE